MKKVVDSILDNTRLIHWFAENRDEDRVKMSSLPLGYVFPVQSSEIVSITGANPHFRERPLKIFCCHRVRDGKQWDVRRAITGLCELELGSLCTVIKDEISSADFQLQVKQHPFVICAQGGGLDPSPKAWQSLVNGSIPIIKRSTLDDAYSQLPVAFVDEWDAGCIGIEQLKGWLEALAPYYEDEQHRSQVIHRLSIDYWWETILAIYQTSVSTQQTLQASHQGTPADQPPEDTIISLTDQKPREH